MNNDRMTDYAALLLRITLGVMFISHAALKVFVFTVPGTVAFFASLGLPAPAAYLTIFAEFFGGLAILLGFRTRTIALLTLPVLLGATVAHSGNGWAFTSPKGGWEYPAFLAATDIVLALLGGGRFTLDTLLRKK